MAHFDELCKLPFGALSAKRSAPSLQLLTVTGNKMGVLPVLWPNLAGCKISLFLLDSPFQK